MTSDTGYKHNDGLIDWFHGTGETFEEAIEAALLFFVNCVVEPDGLRKADFIRKPE